MLPATSACCATSRCGHHKGYSLITQEFTQIGTSYLLCLKRQCALTVTEEIRIIFLFTNLIIANKKPDEWFKIRQQANLVKLILLYLLYNSRGFHKLWQICLRRKTRTIRIEPQTIMSVIQKTLLSFEYLGNA